MKKPLEPHRVLTARKIGRYFECRIEAAWAHEVSAGQFLMVKIPADSSRLLGRPFCISRTGDGWVEFVAAVVGDGTRILSDSVVAGDTLLALGPLGKGFVIAKSYKRVVLVGGGAGVAELMILCKRLHDEGRAPLFIAGAKTAADLMYVDEIKAASKRLYITTEDGSIGEKGLVTDPLNGILKGKEADLVVACGPTPMLAAVATAADKAGIESLVAVEERMACGIGACYGCTLPLEVKGSIRMARVCKEGPVFRGKAFLGGLKHGK